MVKKLKTTSPYIFLGICMLIVVLLVVAMYYMKDPISNINPPQYAHASVSPSPPQSDKVCLSKNQYDSIMHQLEQKQQATNVDDTSTVQNRDYRVIRDPLYPPLNRTDAVTHTRLQQNIDARNMYVPTNDTQDTYRLVGYLINNDDTKDVGGNNWKLFARQKDRHTSDFYMVPTNNNYDIKIQIKDDMVSGERLRDLYTIPAKVTFNTPMLNKGSYDFVEVSPADLSTSSRYL